MPLAKDEHSFAALRNQFPTLQKSIEGKPLVYLDSAATAQKPQCVIDAITDFYQNHYGTVHRTIYSLAAYATEQYEKSRQKIQKLLNASKCQEIIFTRGTTDAINLVAQSFGQAFVGPDDEIIISEMEHHSNIVPWQLLCQRTKAKLLIIPINDHSEILLDQYQNLLSKKTKIVSINHIANATGTINPIEQMIEMAHSYGAKVLIDGAQSVSHLKIDLQKLDADFFAFSGHKMYGPTGVGVLYGKEELLNAMPPIQGGGDMVNVVDFSGTTFNDLPLKFEAGTPMIAEVIGLGAAVDFLQNLDFPSLHAWEQELLAYATKAIEHVKGVRLIGTAGQKSSILSFVVDGVHPLDIGTLLDLRGIAIRTGHHCAQPTMRRFGIPGACRASFAFYNTKQEIDFFVSSLQEVLKLLRM